MNFIFWNTKNTDRTAEIVDLFLENECDIAIFAEYNSDDKSILSSLLKNNQPCFFLPNIGCESIKILTNKKLSDFSIRFETDRFSIREIKSSDCIPTLLCLVHLPSKLYMSNEDQKTVACYLKHDVENAEAAAKHENTIIVGDFNMNPFDSGMFFADALHSVPCKVIAKKEHRVLSGRKHKFFYNPSWNLLGDRNASPGTYYLRTGSYSRMHWNVLDQVIMRPCISTRYIDGSLRIIPATQSTTLIDDQKKPYLSDHFPIAFSIDLSKGTKDEKLMA